MNFVKGLTKRELLAEMIGVKYEKDVFRNSQAKENFELSVALPPFFREDLQ
jgi:hypothetical protein